MKKILILCPSPFGTAPTQRLKYEQYLHLLSMEGFQFTISPFQSKRFWRIIYKRGWILEKVFWTTIGYFRRFFDLLRSPFYDGVYVNLWVTPFGFPFFERLICLLNNRVIYDIDDMVFMTGSDNSRRSIIQKLKGTRKPIVLMKKARYVIVCTPKLEEIALSLNKYKNVVDISSTLDTERFTPVEAYFNKKKITIGWTGTHSTIPFLISLQPVLFRVTQLREIKLLVIANKEFKMEGVDTEFIHWTSEKEIDDLHKIDIGLYPIPSNEWSLGKSSLKALTYMAIAIPFVATAYGTNYRIMENGVQGFMASNDEEWIEYIIQLIDDVELRKKMGIEGRRRVVDYYSLNANLPKYLKVFKTVVK